MGATEAAGDAAEPVLAAAPDEASVPEVVVAEAFGAVPALEAETAETLIWTEL